MFNARRNVFQLTSRVFNASREVVQTCAKSTLATRRGAALEVAPLNSTKLSSGKNGQGWTALTFAAAGLAAAASQMSPVGECAGGEGKGSAAAGLKPGTASANPTVVFVLGGPGAGKGTQCANIVRDYGFCHLSAGDLLRAHMKSGSKDGNMVAEMIKNGQIVPSEVTINLLQKAMKDSGKDKFLIDGFPRNAENRDAFERVMGFDCDFVLFFDCPEDVMEKRLLGRNEGRTDDNIESIRKRFKVFIESSMPVVQYYESLGKVSRVIANKSPEAVYADTKKLFDPYLKESALKATTKLLASIDASDWDTYRGLLDSGLTAFEPEAKGHLVEGIPFHQYLFAQAQALPPTSSKIPPVMSTMSTPKVTLLGGGSSALVTYTRLIQRPGVMLINPPSESDETSKQPPGWWHPAPQPQSSTSSRPTASFVGPPTTQSVQETRVWERCDDSSGVAWKLVHFHRS